ncbi:NAD(P)H-binding protein [Isoalcanivorax indicus]|uniref:NAD(P)H-binding protein n=1 Tax=Isoalcanivorax indicus TaxID=2202653 RepID=UPI000DBAA737|nr:NAD(P)H-binding protein [Isoalcanivorax indicus]
MTTAYRALLLGATGLIGQAVLARLLAHPAWARVTVFTRRPLVDAAGNPLAHDKLVVRETGLDDMDACADDFAVDQVFCCLGTTLRKAGSKAAFRRVDHDYCVEAARLARRQGADHFLVVSAVNANPRARVFYSRIKGEMEAAVEALNFPSLSIIQPSLLLGNRQEFRLGEQVGIWSAKALKPLAGWSDASWLPIESDTVAQAMVAAAALPEPGTRRLRYAALRSLAASSQ